VLLTQKASSGDEQAISTLDITGGTNTVYGNIYCIKYVASPGPHQSTLILNGGFLDLTGHFLGGVDSVGSSSNQIPWYIDSLIFQSGTLRNVSQINGGNSSLVKSGTGTLVLGGTNTYSGGTIVSNGTLVVPNDGALGSGNVTVAAGVLELTGGVTNDYINPAGALIFNPGADPVDLNFTGPPNRISNLSFDGGITFQATGSWGSSSSGAENVDNTHFSGTGTVLVTTPSSLTLTSSANPANFGQPVVFSASVPGTPTGTVTFYNGTTALGSETLASSSTVDYTNDSLPVGTNLITAVYGGDYVYSPATSSVLVQSILPVLISVSGTNLVLQYANSIVGTNYVLVSTPCLLPPITWTPVITNAGTGGTLTFTIPFMPGTTNEFFDYLLQ
jgi:autotransporter-associated beta strand protein